MSEHGSSGHTGPADPTQDSGVQPGGPDRAPTAPQPSYGQAGSNQQPYGTQPPYGRPYGQSYGQPPYAPPPPPGQSPAAGQPYWGPPRMPTTPSPAAGYGGLPPIPGPGAPVGQVPPARRNGRVRTGLVGLVAGALIGGAAGAGVATLDDDGGRSGSSPVAAQNVVIENPESATTATAAAAKAAPSVVTVYVTGRQGGGSGSGVILTEDGFVLTNNHVVAGEGNAVQVRTADGTLYDAEVVGTDPSADLAVVRLEDAANLTAATFADSDGVQVGDVAVAIGAPLGLSNTVTDGIISATGRAVQTGSSQDEATVIDAIQTDAAINPGNSGGALVNGAGEVIGINTAIATVASGGFGGEAQSGNIGVGFAIPSNTAKRIGDEIRETGKATRAFLGVSTRTAAAGPNAEIGTGAEVVTVEPDSAAADAGIAAGDVVTAVGDRPITSSTELTAAVRSEAPGATAELTVRRGNGERTIEVTLGSTG
ncbi:S1C family serine protease [Blastococcus goldschmidtiae]|uniref:Trypsin-like peptidase domain-containing protein n=1 Tax=Blastococcus goldschmidtiae TaxID=3075546 RepID=A0ABU2K6P8_9ACTN|nr:trypsin-like peptidase domain-containing protein [Blastococcus sp. DSM 46792]MDT0275838.1 trypsin-like peptidase domain-containing protein [Blastococcus sp. DSM 46792]